MAAREIVAKANVGLKSAAKQVGESDNPRNRTGGAPIGERASAGDRPGNNQKARTPEAALISRLALVTFLGLLEHVIGRLNLLEALGGLGVAVVGAGVGFLDQSA